MRPVFAALLAVSAAAAPSAAWAAAPNDIIWDTPAPKDAPSRKEPSPAAQGRPNTPAAQPDKNGIIWNAPPVKSPPPAGPLLTPPSAAAQSPAQDKCREFQTTIVIDGKREPAHGTVCQQADGTWRVVNK